jgi:hypothetical protein
MDPAILASLCVAPGRHAVLPGRARTRLVFPWSTPLMRWRYSALYPVHRPIMRWYRLALRLKSAAGLAPSAPFEGDGAELRGALRECLPEEPAASVVMVGQTSPIQKATVQLWGAAGVAAYLKFAKKPAAQARIRNEHEVLTRLPEEIAPRALRLIPHRGGLALVTSPVAGRQMPARMSSLLAALPLLGRLCGAERYAAGEHPWLRAAAERHPELLARWMPELAGRTWPAVIMHGDFAPWNLFRDAGGRVRAIDWEFASLKGFPYLDQAHFILQVMMLIERRDTPAALRGATDLLTGGEVSERLAGVLVRMSALADYDRAISDGCGTEHPALRRWREVWETPL